MENQKESINRNFKDGLFRLLFGKSKENLLSLYNALNGTYYTNTDDLTITTMEDVIYMSMKNDVSCMIDQSLSLYEHQSTYNPNMPIRGLMYFGKLYNGIIEANEHSLYSSTRIIIPTPQYYVFYNGRQERPDREEMRLSDSFAHPAREGTFEWTATVLNINVGHNQKLMKACATLDQYARFIGEVRRQQEVLQTDESAVNAAIDVCIKKGILADFLRKHRAEVMEMCLTTFDEEKYKFTVYEEGMREGREAGIKEGIKEGREVGIKEGIKEGRISGSLEAYILAVKNFCLKFGQKPDEAFEILGVPEELREMVKQGL